jgi:CRP/FNR family transcriptional regulator, cyclic AMP receptor protein
MELASMDKSVLDKRISFLKNVAPFKSLPVEHIEKFASRFQARAYSHRDLIIREGDNTGEFYVISTGKVRILTTNPSGDESCLRVLSSRDIFGELSACDGAPRSASVQALGTCTLLVMQQQTFLNFLRTMPDFSMAFIHFLLEKLRWTTLYSHTIAQYDTAGRLLHLLLHYKDMMGREIIPGKVYEVDLSLNQADLASMVGAKREWVNRLLQQWRKQNLLTYDRGKITLLDLAAVVAERDRRMAMHEEASW